MGINQNTLKVLEWDKITEDLAGFCTGETGKKRCLETEIHSDTELIKKELRHTSEAKYLLDMAVFPPISGVKNTYDDVTMARAGHTLSNPELLNIGKNLATARQIKSFFQKYEQETPLIFEITECLSENRELEEDILETFDEAGNMLDSASRELKSLTLSLKDQSENLKDKLHRFINSFDMSTYLQNTTYTIRNDRYVVPVKVENKAHVPGIVHDISASGATVFIEPRGMVELNNRIKETELKIDAEVKRILSELSVKVRENANELNLNLDILTEIDFIFAKARYSISINATEPAINTEKLVSLKNARHPVLMRVVEKVVPNNVDVGKDFQIMVITGPNTGGKTVILKTVGLCLLMAKAGLHVPADEANIHPFLKIFADIGDEQSLIQSLSTFSGHIKNIIEILENTDENTLILLDEIGAGTDPMEGTALAEALMEDIKKKGAYGLVTTHFSELKALAYTSEGYYNASVEFDTETLSPTYKLIMGLPGKSNAISIAGNLGLAGNIIEEARHNYLEKKDPTGKVLEGLQDTQQKLSKDAKEIEEKKQTIEELKENYNRELEKLKSEKKKIINIYRKKFDTAYFQAKNEIDHLLEDARKKKDERAARTSFSRLRETISEARKLGYAETEKLEPEHKPVNWDKIKLGDSVFIKSLDKDGILISMPDKNNNVQVEVGVLKTKVKKQEIFRSKAGKPKENAPKSRSGFKLEKRNISDTLDVRGETAEDALLKVEYFLDEAKLANFSPIYIIHGHGTGKLRKEIRKYLKTSPYVEKYRPGKDGEGGDGITVVNLS